MFAKLMAQGSGAPRPLSAADERRWTQIRTELHPLERDFFEAPLGTFRCRTRRTDN